jgi:hypothetical protein
MKVLTKEELKNIVNLESNSKNCCVGVLSSTLYWQKSAIHYKLELKIPDVSQADYQFSLLYNESEALEITKYAMDINAKYKNTMNSDNMLNMFFEGKEHIENANAYDCYGLEISKENKGAVLLYITDFGVFIQYHRPGMTLNNMESKDKENVFVGLSLLRDVFVNVENAIREKEELIMQESIDTNNSENKKNKALKF